MSRLEEAVSWSGRDVILILFVVWPSDPGASVPTHGSGTGPIAVRAYGLEDPERRLGTREMYEYDLVFDRVPEDLREVVSSWLTAVLAEGAEAAWFAFEGSFDFEHLLTNDVAGQVFAVADVGTLLLALDDEQREGPGWAQSLSAVRERLLA
jgi:hypothetical protein